MDAEEEIAVAYLLMWRIRKSESLEKSGLWNLHLEVFVLFGYFS